MTKLPVLLTAALAERTVSIIADNRQHGSEEQGTVRRSGLGRGQAYMTMFFFPGR